MCADVCVAVPRSTVEGGAELPDNYAGRPMTNASELPKLQRVGVVGSGLMGSGIAEVCARAGLDVVVREVDAATAEAGQGRLVKSLDRGVASGKLTEVARDAGARRP